MTQSVCRDCLTEFDTSTATCSVCGSDRLVTHPDVASLTTAHIDCDAFYAAVEKRDNPGLKDKPVIIGGGRRGVVTTACYVARKFGPRSAMPMYKALKLCPDAIIIKPNLAKYREVSQEIRAIFDAATPVVEPLSLDEAFLDLAGTQKLFKRTPAASLAEIAKRVETEIGITVSVGLAPNKFLAKMASDHDKPRGFTVIGPDDAVAFLHDQPVDAIPGIGPAMASKLKVDGFVLIKDLQAVPEKELIGTYGDTGRHLADLSRGRDPRRVKANRTAKGVSAETTFDQDYGDIETLSKRLWPLCERVAARLKKSEQASRSVTLKLKTKRFRTLTRSKMLSDPTQLAEVLFETGMMLLRKELPKGPFRLIGIGVADLDSADLADPPDLVDESAEKRKHVEQAMDAVRDKFGSKSIKRGRGL